MSQRQGAVEPSVKQDGNQRSTECDGMEVSFSRDHCRLSADYEADPPTFTQHRNTSGPDEMKLTTVSLKQWPR